MQEKVNFRYSDTDFIAYLTTIGCKYNNIEIVKTQNGKLKAFLYFEDLKDVLLKLYNDYKNGKAIVDPFDYSINRRKINKLIKVELLKFQVNNLDRNQLIREETNRINSV